MCAKQLNEDEFRDRFDAGESLESLGFDLDKAVVEQPEVKRVNVDFPEQIVAKLDRHAAQMGISRQALIKVWIFERLRVEAVSHYRPQEFQSKEEMTNLATGLERTVSNFHQTGENIVDLVEALRRELKLHQLQSESKKKA